MSRNRISKAISSFLVLAITVSLFGCENTENGMTETVETEISFTETTQISEDTVTVSEETSEVVLPLETEPTESDLAVEEEIPEAYKQILDLTRYLLVYREFHVEELGTYNPYLGIYESVSYNEAERSGNDCFINHTSYAIQDIDGNGFEELIIFENEDMEYNRIVAMYTLDQNQNSVLVFYGWSRCRWFLLNDGRFLCSGSSGAAYSSMEIYDWSVDGLSLVLCEKYYTDYIDYISEYEPDSESGGGWFYTTDSDDGFGHHDNSEFVGERLDFDDYYSMIIGFENAKPFSMWPHTYEFFEDDVTWEEANQMCQDNGGHLVTIESESELQTLTTIMSWYELTSNIYCVGGLNIGDDVNGNYVWRTDFSGVSDTDVTIDSALWRTGEPSLTGLTEDGRMVVEPYVAMLYSDSIGTCNLMDVPNDLLDAAPSYSGYIGYVCEYE